MSEFEFTPQQVDAMAEVLFEDSPRGPSGWSDEEEVVKDLFREQANEVLHRALPIIAPLRPEDAHPESWVDYKLPWTFYPDGESLPQIGAAQPYPTRVPGEWRWGYRKEGHGSISLDDIARNRNASLTDALEKVMHEVGMFDEDDSTGLYLAGDSWDTFRDRFAARLSEELIAHDVWKV